MIKLIIGVVITIIVLIVIIKIATRNRSNESYEDEGDIWAQVRKIKRGACKKFKEMLFGC